MDRKTIQCLPNPSQHVPIYLEYFPSSTMLKSMRKSKKLLFLPHFGSPWGRPWGNHAIRCMHGKRIRCLQILSRCMCPSNYNRFWDNEILVENRHFFKPPLHSTPLLGGGVPVKIAPPRFVWKN